MRPFVFLVPIFYSSSKEVSFIMFRKKISPASLFLAILICAFLVVPAGAAEKTGAKTAVAHDGSTVKVHYTLTVDGKEIDTSRGKDPMEFKIGSGAMIPGFEKAVKGMAKGEKKSFSIKPEEGYGQVDPKRLVEVPKEKLPADMKPEPGMMLYASGPGGQPMPVTVAEVKKDSVVMNFNHPLAGKTLNFSIELVAVQ